MYMYAPRLADPDEIKQQEKPSPHSFFINLHRAHLSTPTSSPPPFTPAGACCCRCRRYEHMAEMGGGWCLDAGFAVTTVPLQTVHTTDYCSFLSIRIGNCERIITLLRALWKGERPTKSPHPTVVGVTLANLWGDVRPWRPHYISTCAGKHGAHTKNPMKSLIPQHHVKCG